MNYKQTAEEVLQYIGGKKTYPIWSIAQLVYVLR